MNSGLPAFILSAGRGERMRPMTDSTPKPLLEVGGKPLIAWHLDALLRSGTLQVVINTAWLGEQIEATLGSQWDEMVLSYSREGRDFGHALETAGGVTRGLPLMVKPYDAFWLIAADVFMPDFEFGGQAVTNFLQSDALAHIWLVPNPSHHTQGDFCLHEGRLQPLNLVKYGESYTYACVGLFRAHFFESLWTPIPMGNHQGESLRLIVPLKKAMMAGLVNSEIYRGEWMDVGTPERLEQINQQLRK